MGNCQSDRPFSDIAAVRKLCFGRPSSSNATSREASRSTLAIFPCRRGMVLCTMFHDIRLVLLITGPSQQDGVFVPKVRANKPYSHQSLLPYSLRRDSPALALVSIVTPDRNQIPYYRIGSSAERDSEVTSGDFQLAPIGLPALTICTKYNSRRR